MRPSATITVAACFYCSVNVLWLQIEVHDEFVEYPLGYVKYAYSGGCVEARTHQSGWAARNANNHNQVITVNVAHRNERSRPVSPVAVYLPQLKNYRPARSRAEAVPAT